MQSLIQWLWGLFGPTTQHMLGNGVLLRFICFEPEMTGLDFVGESVFQEPTVVISLFPARICSSFVPTARHGFVQKFQKPYESVTNSGIRSNARFE
mmetsp:Transcript_32874/g.68522  ORF Transcript_32874/g.68522 Transcript_32874/m.68522 type:complete len:96 (-) Transcript_32874:1203-1490(-)